jgi:hypothetical protein
MIGRLPKGYSSIRIVFKLCNFSFQIITRFAMSHSLVSLASIFVIFSVFNVNAMSTILETISNNKTADPSYTNKVALSNTYSMFKHLMEVKEDMTGEQEERTPKVVKIVKQALQSLLEAALKGFM